MDTIRQYILSAICTAILCAIAQLFLSNGSAGTLVKFLSGLLVTIAVLNPVIQNRVFQWDISFEQISQEGAQAVDTGKTAAQSAVSQLIKEKTQTYIMNKASDMGADVTVEVELENEHPYAPESIRVIGNASPYVKERISDCLRRDFGIAEEDQLWISRG